MACWLVGLRTTETNPPDEPYLFGAVARCSVLQQPKKKRLEEGPILRAALNLPLPFLYAASTVGVVTSAYETQ